MKSTRFLKRTISLLLCAGMLLGVMLPVGAAEAEPDAELSWAQTENRPSGAISGMKVSQTAENTENDGTPVRVSILLEDEPVLRQGFPAETLAENSAAMLCRAELEDEQQDMIERIEEQVLDGESLDVAWNLTLAANIISATVPYGSLDAIRALDGVKQVVAENRYLPQTETEQTAQPQMALSGDMIGAPAAWAEGYTGVGTRIAVIDTGINPQHESFDEDAFLYSISGKEELSELALPTEEVWSQLHASEFVGSAEDTFLSHKIPFGANYVDHDLDVCHEADDSGHGSHVAGIAAGNRYVYRDSEYVSALDATLTQGVAPDAQLLVMKVFGEEGGAYDSDCLAAIEDAILLGADSINLSLGTPCAGASNARNSVYGQIMDTLTDSGVLVAASAGNSGFWAEQTVNGELYDDGVNFDTGGAPASFTNMLSVASADNVGLTGPYLSVGAEKIIYFEGEEGGNESLSSLTGLLDYVYLEGIGSEEEFERLGALVEGKILICERGGLTFGEKMDAAAAAGAIACIVVNNQDGSVIMNLNNAKSDIPCVSVLKNDGQKLRAEALHYPAGGYYLGTLEVAESSTLQYLDSTDYSMSPFSSWGVPGSLELKPEITAPGGNIYSTNGMLENDSYKSLSGTSMAAPQIAGMGALLAQYIRQSGLEEKTGLSARQLMQSLLMSTAVPMIDRQSGGYYPVMQQGAGLANVEKAMNADTYILMDEDASAGAADGKVKAELGDDPSRSGEYEIGFTLYNPSEENRFFRLTGDFFTQKSFVSDGVGYLGTSTVPLEADVRFTVDGDPVIFAILGHPEWDFNGDGAVDEDDGQMLLDYCSGALDADGKQKINQQPAADIDEDHAITTADVYAFFSASTLWATVPAHGSAKVQASVKLLDADAFDNGTGIYVEGFLHADEITSAEGALGERHSIPVLGYYGSWTEPSMFDVGSMTDYLYGTEERLPYLCVATGEAAFYSNVFLYQHDGEPDLYAFAGNPVEPDEIYMPERNAISAYSSFAGVFFSPIRGAAASRFTVEDEDGTILYEKEGKPVIAAFVSSEEEWENALQKIQTEYSPDRELEGHRLTVRFALAPEYYAGADGSVDWDALDGGAELCLDVSVDATAPIITDMREDHGTLTVTAEDNQYVAGFALVDGNDQLLELIGADPGVGEAESAEYTIALRQDISSYLLEVYDYAGNYSTYEFKTEEQPVKQNSVQELTASEAVTQSFCEAEPENEAAVMAQNVGAVQSFTAEPTAPAVSLSEDGTTVRLLLQPKTGLGAHCSSSFGLMEILYDSEKAHYQEGSWNSYTDYSSICVEDGKITVAYVDMTPNAPATGIGCLELAMEDQDLPVNLSVEHLQCGAFSSAEIGQREHFVINPDLHTKTKLINAVAPKPGKTGYTGDLVCAICGKLIQRGEVLPALAAHSGGGTPVPKVVEIDVERVEEEPIFTDVSVDSWYYTSVKLAKEKGLINGIGQKKFGPDKSLTVAEAIKLSAALHQMTKDGSVTLKKGSPWYEPYVRYAVENGILEESYLDLTCAEYGKAVTRAEFVHILYGAMSDAGYKALNTVADDLIPDVRMTDRFAAQIYTFYRAGILNGNDSQGNFLPYSKLKRSEAAAILLRMFDVSARKIFGL